MADNNSISQVKSVINSIPFEEILGGPLVACVGAQRDASFTAYKFMREVTMNTGKDGEAEPVMVSFSFIKDGKKLKLNVPLLTIVPLPFIQIDYVDLAFTANVTATEERNGEAHLTAKYSTETGDEQEDKTEDGSSMSSFTDQNIMKVNIRAVTSDMPPGIAKMQQIFGQHLVFDEIVEPEPEPTPEPESSLSSSLSSEPEVPVASERLQSMIDDAKNIVRYDLGGPTCFVVEDVYNITGRGTVLAGNLISGTIKAGDEASVYSPDKKQDTTITAIERFRKMMDSIEGGPDIQAGLLITGLAKTDVKRGDIVTQRSSVLSLRNKMEATIRLLTKEEGGRHTPIQPGYRGQCKFFNIMDITGAMTLAEGKDMILPGETADVTIELAMPYYLRENDGFLVSEGGRTVAVGIINKVISE